MKPFCFGFVVFLHLFLQLISDLASFEIKIEPEHMQIRPSGAIEVRCFTEPREPISACQFRVWYVDKRKEGMLFNAPVSGGTVTVSAKNLYDPGTNYTAELFGDDSLRDCSVRFSNLKGDQLLIGCKIITKAKGSAMKTMSVYFHEEKRLLLVDNNVQLVTHARENVSVTVKSSRENSLNGCICTLPNDGTVSITNYEHTVNRLSFPVGKNGLYGPSSHTCGFTINNVKEEDSGVFFIFGLGAGRSIGAKAVTLIVTRKSPFRLDMSLSKDAAEYDDGEVVTVTCRALGVRQTATRWRWWWSYNSTSLQRPIEPAQGQLDDSWTWPWEEVSQSVTLTLTRRDHLDVLSCSTDGFTARKLIAFKRVVTSDREISTTLATSSGDALTQATLRIDAGEDDVVSIHNVFHIVLLVVLIILITAGAIVYLKLKRCCCFRDKHMRSALEPVYDEINDELAAKSLASHSKSSRAVSIDLKEMVSAKRAHLQPEEPEYIIPNAPDTETWPVKKLPKTSQSTCLPAKKVLQKELGEKLAQKRPVTQESSKQAERDILEGPDGYLKPIMLNKAKHV